MSTATVTERFEKLRETNRETREANELLARENRKLKTLTGSASEELEKLRGRATRFAARLDERDSPERTLLVSVASGVSAAVTTAALNYGIRAIAAKSPWLNARVDYAQGLPHIVIGYGAATAELATRPRGAVSTGREILYRFGENFGHFGLYRVVDAYWERRQQQARAVRQALDAARAARQPQPQG